MLDDVRMETVEREDVRADTLFFATRVNVEFDDR